MSSIDSTPNQRRVAALPDPSKTHATCAWCLERFTTIIELIDHVDHGHVVPFAAA
jgi:hypothetical protein